ncbi:MAG: hypothetical protein HZA89_06700 [Verrucomicrobia bacterium]|nr:hypothetical protein [Verrucomicrobiota bacterium]
MKVNWNVILPVLLLAAFAVTRWPGLLPLNFSATYALVFCSGAFRQRLPWWAVFGVMLFTDVCLNLFYYRTEIFSDYQAVNYLAYAAIFFLGRQFGARAAWLKLVGGGLLGAVLFYFVTNTAAWLQNPEYTKTIAGWIQALTIGTSGWPETWKFFANTLMSGGLFTGLIAAAMKLEPAEPEAEKEPESEEAPEAAPEKNEA